MSINDTSKIATRKQLSFEVEDLVYTPTETGFKRSDGLIISFMQMLIFSMMNPDLKAKLI